MAQLPVVVMGVSGAGKTTIGAALASRLGRPFIDADDLHLPENRDKMRIGIPLEDADRAPWLERVGSALREARERGTAPVVACSALKASYREILRRFAPDVGFLHLSGDPETVAARLQGRDHAYMPESLMSSQFATLEPPAGEDRVLTVDLRTPVEELTLEAMAWIRALENDHSQLEETR